MTLERLADRLAGAAAEAMVGRSAEREHLARLLRADPGPAVVFLHGAGGIGKSLLVADTLDHLGWTDVRIDGRHAEPTPRGILAAIGDDLGLDPGDAASVEGVAASFTDLEVRVLAVDSYEHLGVVDGWIRNDLLPALPATVRTVISGRNPPNVAWRASRGWRRLIAEQPLGPLTESDAAALVARHALPPALARKALRFGRGHPLALELAAEAYARRPQLELHDGPSPEVVEELVDVLYEGLDAEDRRIAEAASVLRRVTEPLLAAVLDTDDVTTAWRALRDLPFTTITPHGLEVNPVVQDVTATALELRNPRLARELRRRAARAALEEVERSPGWGPTADLLHLVQKPVIRNAFAPPAGFQHPVEQARPADRDEILAISERFDGPVPAGLLARWWDVHAADFVVARGPAGEVSAFSVVVPIDRLDPSLAQDPIAARALDDMRRRPLPDGMRALLNRQLLSARRGARVSPELAPMLIDIKRLYFELRPHLGRVYVPQDGAPELLPMMAALEFAAVGEPFEIGGVPQLLTALDFGPASVDGWLARHVEAETASGRAADVAPTDAASGDVPHRDAIPAPVAATAPPVPAGIEALSPREIEVLAALTEGLSNHELAERLFISERTANRHLSNIFTKLGVHNRTAAARIAIAAGIAG